MSDAIELPLTKREQNALMHVIAAAHGARDGQTVDVFDGDLNIASYLVDRILRLRAEAEAGR